MSLKRQRGLALVALVAMLALGASWYIISALNAGSANRTTQNRSHNARVLAQAKQALIGYVATLAANETETYPGRLPCPEHPWNWYWSDTDSTNYADRAGTAGPSVGLTSPGWGSANCSAVGRFPWRTVGAEKFLDASGEPLWYVVTVGAGGWALQSSATTLSINSNKPGGLSVDGVANTAVAVIIAPGRPLSSNPNASQLAAGCISRNQSRAIGGEPDYRNYLECQDPASGTITTNPVDNAVNEVSNDQVVTVTAADVMTAVEAVVAKRIEAQVVPQMKGVYASATWGTTASNPIYPFAAPFTSTASSAFQGSAGTEQGLMPIATNVSLTWKTSSPAPAISKVSGSATVSATNCSTSTPTTVKCSITYSGSQCITAGASLCSATINARVTATAANVGLGFHTLGSSGITGFTSVTSVTGPLQATGASAAVVDGALPPTTCTTTPWIFSLYRCTPPARTESVTVPVSIFGVHSFVNPTAANDWYWFFVNRWYDVTYYAVAPSNLPGGALICPPTSACITVNGAPTASNNKAILVLTGRSLTNAARPSANLSDYLDSAENQDLNRVFEQKAVNRSSFNDRFVSLGSY